MAWKEKEIWSQILHCNWRGNGLY